MLLRIHRGRGILRLGGAGVNGEPVCSGESSARMLRPKFVSHRTLFPARRQAFYPAITMIHTMPLSSKTTASAAPHTAHPLNVHPPR